MNGQQQKDKRRMHRNGGRQRKAMAKFELPFIERNVSRHHKVRYYYRVDGKRIGRLPDNPESAEFTAEYWRIRNGMSEAASTDASAGLSNSAKQGSFHHLCINYLQSSAYMSLDKTTQAKRRSIIDSMLLERISPTSPHIFAKMPVSELDTGNIEVLRDRKKDTPFAADERLKILRQIFEAGIPKLVKQNHAKLVKSFRKKTEGHATLHADDIAQYINKHGVHSKAVLALTILMYTGVRVSDLALMGAQHRRGDVITLRVFKNRNRNPITLELPVHPILDAVLKLHPAKTMTYVTTEHDKPFSIKGLGNRISDWFTQAGLPHLTAHSVRKGLATNIAENEATDLMLEGMFGWKDSKTSKIYTRNAQRSKLARQAVSKIDWGVLGKVLPHPILDEEFQTNMDKKSAK